MEALKEVRERLEKDFYSPAHEWEFLESLSCSDSEWIELLNWVFVESPAYWATRARAGHVLLQENEEETWKLIEMLVDSADPDDNGTALTIFEELNGPRGFELARCWLKDGTHPATQLEAIEFLKDVYPEEARQRLEFLRYKIHPRYEKWVEKIVAKFGKED